MRVLVVDDEPALAAHLSQALSTAGYAVDVASDGERADFVVRTESYDAVAGDIDRIAGGAERLREVRSQRRFIVNDQDAHIEIVLYSVPIPEWWLNDAFMTHSVRGAYRGRHVQHLRIRIQLQLAGCVRVCYSAGDRHRTRGSGNMAPLASMGCRGGRRRHRLVGRRIVCRKRRLGHQ